MKTFDDELNVCKTWNRSLSKRAFPCQPVHSKMSIEPLPKELQSLRLENILIFKKILFKKVAIMHGKGELTKLKGNICNIIVENENVMYFLFQDKILETN